MDPKTEKVIAMESYISNKKKTKNNKDNNNNNQPLVLNVIPFGLHNDDDKNNSNEWQ